jgi:hypothetical protein
MKDAQSFNFMLQPGGPVSFASLHVTAGVAGPTEECTADRFVIQGEKAWLAGRVLAPQAVTMRVLPGIGNVNVKEPMTLKIATPGPAKEVEFVVVLVPLVDGETAPDIQPLKAGQAGAQIGKDRIIFDPEGKRPPRRE